MLAADAQAFARLYAQHYPAVRAFCARRVGLSEAEEVTAEVFLVAWRKWPDPAAPGLPWLYATARHVIGNHLRGQRRRDEAVQHLLRETSPRTASNGTAEDGVERIAAARALLSLREQDRTVLLAVAWDGLSTTDLATALGCTAAAAYVRLHRARRRLAVLMSEDEQCPKMLMEEFQ